MANKSEKLFEKGDMPIVLKVQSTTYVIVIDDSRNKFIPKFFDSDNFSEFWNWSHE